MSHSDFARTHGILSDLAEGRLGIWDTKMSDLDFTGHGGFGYLAECRLRVPDNVMSDLDFARKHGVLCDLAEGCLGVRDEVTHAVALFQQLVLGGLDLLAQPVVDLKVRDHLVVPVTLRVHRTQSKFMVCGSIPTHFESHVDSKQVRLMHQL
jgi:hypothetical protein